ncbi:MAG TPA: DNA polymerase I [Candidatus Deferrimicrobium sp.]|nr:DNA polymerase I [Candidatus Deferrimicrobium sp.]
MNETILLIDGMYLVFSSFYSYREMRTLKGEPTGATFGFITRVENLIRDLKPNRIGVAFDLKEKTFRHNLFSTYKSKRLSPPEELVAQMPLIKEYLGARGIPVFEFPGFEADDIIAGISKREAAAGNRVIIFTADKDLFQLVAVSENIFIYHPKLKEALQADGIKEHFGVSAAQIVDYLCLTGDSSDNIPGVPGIGEKTALKLMEQFGSVDHMLAHIDEVNEKIKTKIQANLDCIHIARQLIDLANAPEMNIDVQFEPFKNEITDSLVALYERLSFQSLLKKLKEGDEGYKIKEKEKAGTPLNIQYEIIKNLNELKELKKKILEEKFFAYDVETTCLEFFKADMVGLSISFESGGYYIPFQYSKSRYPDMSITFDDFKTELKEVFENEEIKKTGHNLKFDILHLKRLGIEVKGIKDDSMVMSYLLHPNRRAHNLKELTLELLNYKQVEYEQLVGKGKEQRLLISVDLPQLSNYCIDDSNLALRLIKIMEKEIDEKGLRHLYETIEMPLVKVLADMEYVGVKLDVAFLKETALRFAKTIAEIEEEIFTIACHRFNVNSSQQLGELLFEKMNLPIKKRTRKTKSYSTDNEVLNELKNFPIVSKIIDYRTYKKILSTYLEGLTTTIDAGNRVHTSYNQTVTATGRLSSSEPNLQNIPVGKIRGIDVRDAFISEEGKLLLAADYSQIELRVMAHFSKDKNLVEAFENDFDIHQHTADTVFAKDLFLSEKERRKRAKVINFSVLYGTGAFSLSKELGVSYREAQSFIDMYFEKHIGVKAYIDEVLAGAEKNPEVKTISGRRRYIPELLSANKTVKENGKRMAINTTIQGSAADIIKIAMINIHKKLATMKSKLIMQVHDELVFEYPLEEESDLFNLVKTEMESALELIVPLKVTLKKGKTWGTMEDVKI